MAIENLFDLAGIALTGWLLMILFPAWRGTRKVVQWELFPLLLALLYAVGIAIVLRETGPGIVNDFGSAEGVLRILGMPSIALVAWIHILAFDQLVAVHIFRENLAHRYMSLWLQSLILFLTLMFGPLGYLAFYMVRLARRGSASADTAAGVAP